METTIERLKNQVLAGQPLADVTVLDLLGKLELLQQEALEAQEDAIHQTARAEQAEAALRRVRELHKPTQYRLPSDDPRIPETVCSECLAEFDGVVEYPCPTIKALDGAA